MAILVNIGQRGFVLKEGFVGPTQQITVDNDTAEKLAKMYPKELKIVMMSGEGTKSKEEVVEEVKEEVKEPVVEPEQPKKATRKRKK